MTLRQLKSKYRCIANPTKRPHKLKMYDFKRKKYTLTEFHGIAVFGCQMCKIGNDHEKIYLVEGKAMHESCALEYFNKE